LHEGTLKITAVPDASASSAAQIAPATIEMRTNFWRRPWNRRTFVINPDRSAAIEWEETQYAEAADENYVPERRVYLGEVLYDLAKPDYVFQDFPTRLSLGENKTITKTRIGMAKDEGEVIAVLAGQVPPKAQIAFLRQHLADRPLRLQFHRYYQGLVEVQEPNYDLAGEYRALVKNEPNDAQLVYLLARVVGDYDESLRLFQQSADAPRPCAYADYALAFDAISAAHFDEALKRANAADALEPGNYAFLEVQLAALEALGKFDEAVAALKGAEKAHDLTDAPLVGAEVRLLASKGDLDGAKKRIDAFCKELSASLPDAPEVDAHIRLPMEATMHYAAGDMAAYRAALSARTSPDAKFAAAVTDGKLEDAQSALGQMKSAAASDHLTLYIAARLARNDAIAQTAWKTTLDLLSKDRRDQRLIGKAIAGADPPSASDLRNFKALPTDRAIMLTALGLRFPSKQSEYFATARALNFSKRFPSHVITQAITGKAAATTP
jgi:hypothetical protein